MASRQHGELDRMMGCLSGAWLQSQSILPHEEVENPLVVEGLQMEGREKSMHPDAYENWLLNHNLLAVKYGMGYLTPLSLSFSISEMGIVKGPILWGCYEDLIE